MTPAERAKEQKQFKRIGARVNPQQELAIKLFTEKLLKGEPIEIKPILRQAGYAETTVQQSQKVMGPIREKLAEVVEKMERIRTRALDRMVAEVETAPYDSLLKTADVLTKNVQLLTGGATSNVAMIIDDQARAKSNDAIREYLNSRHS